VTILFKHVLWLVVRENDKNVGREGEAGRDPVLDFSLIYEPKRRLSIILVKRN